MEFLFSANVDPFFAIVSFLSGLKSSERGVAAVWNQCTVGQTGWNWRIQFIDMNLSSMSLRASEWVSEQMNELSGARKQGAQCGAIKKAALGNKQVDVYFIFSTHCAFAPHVWIHCLPFSAFIQFPPFYCHSFVHLFASFVCSFVCIIC